jgi:hypothetical protein
VIRDAVGAGVMAPTEVRAKLDLKPVTGGDSPFLQQQNYSLEALAKRDAQADPFAPATPPAPAVEPAPPAEIPPPQKSVPLEDMGGIFDRALFAHREAA